MLLLLSSFLEGIMRYKLFEELKSYDNWRISNIIGPVKPIYVQIVSTTEEVVKSLSSFPMTQLLKQNLDLNPWTRVHELVMEYLIM